jgi:hypothetical protein
MAFDTDAIVERIRTEAARRLLAAALALQAAYRGDVSVGNPAPHDDPAPRGDYPRLRTGGGRANVAVEPASVARVAAEGAVSVGHRKAGAHLYWLAGKGWKGILDTLRRERARIRQVLGGGGP